MIVRPKQWYSCHRETDKGFSSWAPRLLYTGTSDAKLTNTIELFIRLYNKQVNFQCQRNMLVKINYSIRLLLFYYFVFIYKINNTNAVFSFFILQKQNQYLQAIILPTMGIYLITHQQNNWQVLLSLTMAFSLTWSMLVVVCIASIAPGTV